jgi:hypothetical protein
MSLAVGICLTLSHLRSVTFDVLWITFIDVQEDKSRVEIFGLYARKNRESVFGPFLNMLNRPDTFTINQASLINVYCLSVI